MLNAKNVVSLVSVLLTLISNSSASGPDSHEAFRIEMREKHCRYLNFQPTRLSRKTSYADRDFPKSIENVVYDGERSTMEAEEQIGPKTREKCTYLENENYKARVLMFAEGDWRLADVEDRMGSKPALVRFLSRPFVGPSIQSNETTQPLLSDYIASEDFHWNSLERSNGEVRISLSREATGDTYPENIKGIEIVLDDNEFLLPRYIEYALQVNGEPKASRIHEYEWETHPCATIPLVSNDSFKIVSAGTTGIHFLSQHSYESSIISLPYKEVSISRFGFPEPKPSRTTNWIAYSICGSIFIGLVLLVLRVKSQKRT